MDVLKQLDARLGSVAEEQFPQWQLQVQQPKKKSHWLKKAFFLQGASLKRIELKMTETKTLNRDMVHQIAIIC